MRRIFQVLLLALLYISVGCDTKEIHVPAAPTERVTDHQRLLRADTRTALSKELAQYEATTSNQFIVYISDSTRGVPLEDWCNTAFKQWGIGQKDKNNGLVLFVFTRDKKLRFETGYGLEGTLPDVKTKRITSEIMVPQLKAGHLDDAILLGVQETLKQLGYAPTIKSGGASHGNTDFSALGWILLLIFGLIVAAAIIGGGGRRRRGSWDSGSSWDSSSSSSWGGGGGDSGGGGSSDSW